MNLTIIICIALFLLTFLMLTASGGSAVEGQTPSGSAQSPAGTPPVDHLVTTRHSIAVRGRSLDYSVTAGTMVVDTAGGKCEIFFAAYTVEETDSAAERPLTFVFNGGPGSSSEWMHMGFLGPRRIAFDKDGQVSQFPAPI